MPELSFHIRWPDGAEDCCYSPSSIVATYLAAGDSYPVADFVARCRTALTLASDRVRARHGYPCARAAGQLAAIEARAARYAAVEGARVRCLAIDAPDRGRS